MSNARKSVIILRVEIDSTTESRVLRYVQSRLNSNNKFFITTPNPEIVLKAHKDDKLLNVINNSDIKLSDGIGLSMAAKYLSLDVPNNILLKSFASVMQGIVVGVSLFVDPNWLKQELEPIKGREMFIQLVKLSNKKKYKVFLLGGNEDVAEQAAQELKKNYKSMTIGSATGPILDDRAFPIDSDQERIEKETIQKINRFKPDILFVGFGAPKQEKWVDKWLHELRIGGAMVVGGTFDYLSGNAELPPEKFSGTGLEWLWRLFKQPKRYKRIINALIVFPWNVFLSKFE